jgi:hypothetical protein
LYVYRGFVLPLAHKQSARKSLFTLADIRIYRVRASEYVALSIASAGTRTGQSPLRSFELRHAFLLPSLPLRSRCLRTRFAAKMPLSCRQNLKQVFSQSANAGDAQKRSYFSPLRCQREVLFALWECRNSDWETSERRGIMHDFMASDGPDRLDLRVLGGYQE